MRNVTIALILTGSAVFAEPVTIVALGDSLTSGYGLPRKQGFVPVLEAWLRAKGADVEVQNAGVSGDTTAGGMARVGWALGDDADAVIVTLGGNDMLRGLDPASSKASLEGILREVKARDLPALLVGIQALGNYGPGYRKAFDRMYGDLSEQYGTLLAPSFFDGLYAAGGDFADPVTLAPYMQGDGIHPNAEGVVRIVEALGPRVLELVGRVK